MGIDVYLRWDGITEEEKQKQYTGFSVVHGHVGYLREAYHGSPYATSVLVQEGTDKETENGFIVSNKTLQERLPEVLKTAIRRAKEVYSEIVTEEAPIIQSFVDFVKLHKEKEEAGLNPTIIVSG